MCYVTVAMTFGWQIKEEILILNVINSTQQMTENFGILGEFLSFLFLLHSTC